MHHSAVTIVPSADLDASQAFYERLGFALDADYPHHGYRILHDPHGAAVHLTRVEPDWIDAGRTAYGIYFYTRDVDRLAAAFGAIAEDKPWRCREFAVSDPSGTLVRVGWPLD